MKRWEYRVTYRADGEDLRHLGESGWELVCAVQELVAKSVEASGSCPAFQCRHIFYFKRELGDQ